MSDSDTHFQKGRAVLKNSKEQIIKALEGYGVIVCRPEERSIEELKAVMSVFDDSMDEEKA